MKEYSDSHILNDALNETPFEEIRLAKIKSTAKYL